MINGFRYIGQSKSPHKRIREHRYCRTNLVGRAIQKYGWKNFKIEILECCEDNDIDNAERYYIGFFNSIHPYGYNIESGGCERKQVNEETKEKLSKIRNEQYKNPKLRDKISNGLKRYYSQNPEALLRLKQMKQNQKASPETSIKKSKTLKKHYEDKNNRKIMKEKHDIARCNNLVCKSSTGYFGVYFLKKTNHYEAYINYNRRRITIGHFKTALDAALARDKKSKELMGEYALLNFK